MTDATFEPFADDAAVLTADGVTIENGTDAIVMTGDATFTRDRRSLAAARALAKTLTDIVTALEKHDDLPEAAEPDVDAPGVVDNPFGGA